MRKIKLYILICISLCTASIQAQDKNSNTKGLDQSTFGVGLGMDYGGIGCNYTYCPVKFAGFFAGGGYAMWTFGYNIGVKLRTFNVKESRIPSFYAFAMYGYNTTIVISNAEEYNKLFYGCTFGIGIDFNSRYRRIGYWSLEILFPMRGPDVDSYINDLQNNHGINFQNSLSTVGFSIGYKFKLTRFEE